MKLTRMRARRRGAAVALATGAAALVLGALPLSFVATASASPTTISMIVSDYMFNSTSLANQYTKQLEKEWNSRYPSVKLDVIQIPGTDVDEATALALRFKETATTPDVIAAETPYLSQYAAAGYLRTLNGDLSGSQAPSFWTEMPRSIQQLTTFGGSIYGVSPGVNDQGILYSKDILKKAGIPLPWNPKNWAQMISAAERIKARVPGVVPMWLGAGVGAGPFNFAQGIANLIFGSTTPTIFDTKTNQWVVGSPGLSASFAFYSKIFAGGMGAPISQLFGSQAIGTPVTYMMQGKLGIMIGANWMPEQWYAPGQSLYWPKAAQHVGIAPLPTEFGQSPGTVSEMSGWAYAVTKAAADPSLAWDLVKMNMEAQNELDASIWSGFVPADPAVAASKANLAFAPGFNAGFNAYVKNAVSLPTNQNITVYARAINTATGDIAQYPQSTKVSDALNTVKNLLTEQLGPGSTTTIK